MREITKLKIANQLIEQLTKLKGKPVLLIQYKSEQWIFLYNHTDSELTYFDCQIPPHTTAVWLNGCLSMLFGIKKYSGFLLFKDILKVLRQELKLMGV